MVYNRESVMNKNYRLGELFCGPGGIGAAAKLAKVKKNGLDAGFTHVWATDYDKDSCDTYRKNLKAKHVVQIPIEELFRNKKHLEKLPSIDCLSFGFPCNDFSNVGEKKGINGKFGPLYTYCVEALDYFNPKWFFAENVSGIKSSNLSDTFSKILRELKNAGKGYDIFPHLYKFEQYNVPQARHRVIIIGIRKDLKKTFYIPAPVATDPEDYLSCESALKGIDKRAHNHEVTKNSEIVTERLNYIKPGKNVFNSNLPPKLKLNIKGAKMSMIYKRLDPKKPAYTITGSGGGGTHTYHWKYPRALTNRERARLQTFPDTHIFCGSKESQRKQLGMAVPVEGAKIILQSVLKCLNDMPYKYIGNNINTHNSGIQLKLNIN